MTRKPPRMYDPGRPAGKPPSERQKVARDRNWRIFKLRGLWYQAWALTGERRDAMQALVDQEIALLGAEGEGPRRERQREDRERYERFRAALIGDQVVY